MYIGVNGVNIHYECVGKGIPIILLNGNSKNTSYMKVLGEVLSKRYKVYLFDRRCCGKSTKECELTYEDSAEDIHEFIKKLEIDKPIILGHSGGGTVALHFAIKYKECVSKLILCSSAARYNGKYQKTMFEKIISLFPIYPGKKSYERFIKLVKEARTITKQELENISVPTLVINGDKDIISADEAKYLANNISNAKLLILKDATHSSYMIKVDWEDEIINFIEEK